VCVLPLPGWPVRKMDAPVLSRASASSCVMLGDALRACAALQA
jgi:hypothetical protein